MMSRDINGRRRRSPVILVAASLLIVFAMAQIVSPAIAQNYRTPVTDDRFAGLQWTFARIRYTAWTLADPKLRDFWGGEPWQIDWHAAEDNLSRRLRTVTSIQVNEPVVLTIEDPRLMTHPWIYIVEPGNLRFTEQEVPILREFLLRGGTLTFDDFHGPIEWANVEQEMKRIFPERSIVELPKEHPIYSCFYQISEYPQTPGLGSFLNGRTWEKGGYTARLRAIEDDTGRAMVLFNWNTDMGDGWEWSNAEDYPGYIRHTGEAYRMMINEIIYTLTH